MELQSSPPEALTDTGLKGFKMPYGIRVGHSLERPHFVDLDTKVTKDRGSFTCVCLHEASRRSLLLGRFTMRCPRCETDDAVEGTTTQDRRGTVWVCHACNISFTPTAQVIRPLKKDSLWVEKGSGTRVRVLDVDGDPFGTLTIVRYQAEAYQESIHTMTALDFRVYFRIHKPQKHRSVMQAPCREGEEWESRAGVSYRVLTVDALEGIVQVTASEHDPQAFWVRFDDFTAEFQRVTRETDYTKLLRGQ